MAKVAKLLKGAKKLALFKDFFC